MATQTYYTVSFKGIEQKRYAEEDGNTIEDFFSRVYWNIVDNPNEKGKIKILKPNLYGTYNDEETKDLLNNLKIEKVTDNPTELQNSFFFFCYPIIPGFSLYSEVKALNILVKGSSIQSTNVLSINQIFEQIHIFYSRKIESKEQYSSGQKTLEKKDIIDYKTILNLISSIPNTTYSKYLQSRVEEISQKNQELYNLFPFRTLFNGFVPSHISESIKVKDQTFYSNVYMISLSSTICVNLAYEKLPMPFKVYESYLEDLAEKITKKMKQKDEGRGGGKGGRQSSFFKRGKRNFYNNNGKLIRVSDEDEDINDSEEETIKKL